ncbi:MAG: NAD-dependent dihydropyrimidine dehydrogenase subunit PreA, partial [Candidatus Omnitrophota bacterium]
MDLRTSFLNIHFENPFVLASAPPTADGERIRRAFEAGWAGAVMKTIISEPVRQPKNRFAVSHAGGSITGFENLELLSELTPEEWYRTMASLKADFPEKIVIGSIMADARSGEKWVALARGCQEAGADMVELNFSCPHGYPEKGNGAAIGQNAEYAEAITGWIKNCKDIRIPVIPKLTAAVADIRHIGEAVARAGADGLCAINTLPSFFGFDLKSLRPKPDICGLTAYGGYSGPGIKPLALRAVMSLCQSPGLPVMASGGIASGFDAAEFMLSGAPVVQVGTEVMLRGYGIIRQMRDELCEFMEWHHFAQTSDFIGRCKNSVVAFSGLDTEADYQAVLRAESCTKCGACVTACRDGGYGAIALSGDDLPVMDPSKCGGCSLCSHVCPSGAI